MAFPQTQPSPVAESILRDPGGYFESPMAVVWDPHLDHDERIEALAKWLDHERLLFRADRDTGRVIRMRQIESALRTLQTARRGEGRR